MADRGFKVGDYVKECHVHSYGCVTKIDGEKMKVGASNKRTYNFVKIVNDYEPAFNVFQKVKNIHTGQIGTITGYACMEKGEVVNYFFGYYWVHGMNGDIHEDDLEAVPEDR